MINTALTGAARARIPAREQLDQEELTRLLDTGALVVDDRRRRPLYFDGRFLAARDLTREQSYFLTRQADLARTTGTGVVEGLMVSRGPNGGTLRIDPGHGVTPAGEAVILPAPLTIPLANIPQTQTLDAAFGILRQPAEPARTRTGLFIVALRPVEFSANPIASYPTTITGRRTIEDGDIVEGVVATLIPFPDPGGDAELSRRRARTARTLFVDGSSGGMPVDALPLAMVALEHNTLRWLDVDLVRRELGADGGGVLGFGLAPRAVREAHIRQFDQHLQDVLADRDAANRGRRFAATEHFLALPPAGRFPAQAINTTDFTQIFFPAQVSVDLSIIPIDEVPALLQESLYLPPIDLTLPPEALTSTAVLVLVALPLERVRTLKATLQRLTRPLPAAAPGLVAQRTPLEALRGLRVARLPALPDDTLPQQDSDWATQVATAASSGSGLLWFVRRRNLDYRSDVAGVSVPVVADSQQLEARVADTIRTLGLQDRVDALRSAATPLARADLERLLGSRAFTDSPVLARAMIGQLEAAVSPADGAAGTGGAPAPTLDRNAVLKVAETFSDPQLGEGLLRLAAADPRFASDATVAEGLANSGLAVAVDQVARSLPDAAVPDTAGKLADAAAAGDTAALKAALDKARTLTLR